MFVNLNNFDLNSVPSPQHEPNELNERLIGIPALNPFIRSVSGPRASMFNKHILQRPTILKPTKQRLVTGVATELGKYTYKKELPANAYIIDTIAKYGASINRIDDFRNPLTTVIFEDPATHEIDILDLTTFHSQHQYFGFEYKYDQKALGEIYPRNRITHDTVIADSPAKQDGEYAFGLHVNVALSSDPVSTEDGIKISESFAKKLQFELFETRTLLINNEMIPLNIYGDRERYQMFPNIGEKVREDGVIFASREYNQDTAPTDLSYKNLTTVNLYDTCIYARAGAEIVDIEVIKGDITQSSLLEKMNEQLFHHYDVANYYYKRIYDAYLKLKANARGNLKLSNRFHTLVKTAYGVLNSNQNKLAFRGKNKISGWIVNIKYKYRMTPKLGYKVTNIMGGKGVICAIVPDEQMYVNEIGTRADIIMDSLSPYKRSIIGIHHEIYINASLDKLIYDIKNHLAKDNSLESYQKAYEYILGFYKICSPIQYELMINNPIDIVQHVNATINGDASVYLPVDNPVDYMEVVDLLEQHYPACLGPVTYTNADGKKITTKNDILVGGCYMILLDKITTESSAVSSAKTQHFGVPATLNKTNKYTTPARDQPTKAIAEDESRLLEYVLGGELAADILDQTNNPDVHKSILKNIYSTDKPSAIEKIVDRQLQPMGHGYIQNMVNNVLFCAGVKFVPTGEDNYATESEEETKS